MEPLDFVSTICKVFGPVPCNILFGLLIFYNCLLSSELPVCLLLKPYSPHDCCSGFHGDWLMSPPGASRLAFCFPAVEDDVEISFPVRELIQTFVCDWFMFASTTALNPKGSRGRLKQSVVFDGILNALLPGSVLYIVYDTHFWTRVNLH